MLLRGSQQKGSLTNAGLLEIARPATTHDPGGYRGEFPDGVRRANAPAGR
jgi:hypothetical protein